MAAKRRGRLKKPSAVIPAQAGILAERRQCPVYSKYCRISNKIPDYAGMTAFLIFQAALGGCESVYSFKYILGSLKTDLMLAECLGINVFFIVKQIQLALNGRLLAACKEADNKVHDDIEHRHKEHR